MLRLSPIAKDAEGTASLQELLQAAPHYANVATGETVSETAAQSILAALPPGKQYNDKFVLGAYEHEALIGCVDLIRGYPCTSIAYIGLLIIAERSEGKGYGAQIFNQTCEFVAQWNACTKLRLGVLETNSRATEFWLKLGFRATGEAKPYNFGQVSTQALLYERALPTAA